MKLYSLEQLYFTDLQDIYDAERQLLKALPKLARSASSSKLSQGFQRHTRQTEEQIKRLETIFEEHGGSPKGRKCPAMAGLIAEANEVLQEELSPELLDVGVITAAQKVEHYEISAYTSAISLAQSLGFQADVRLLERTLKEEEQTEQQLAHVCEKLLQEQKKGQGQRSFRGQSGNQRSGRSMSNGARGGRGSSKARATRDHQEIRRWAEERGGAPASVKGTGKRGEAGLLRLDFPGYSGERTLQHIPWDQWFQKFDKENLEFLYQDRTKDGRESRFFKLVCEPKRAAAR
jgi:ferritin-like metal-binding protein YciE